MDTNASPVRTLLIVDDVSINRAILRKIFASRYRVLEAENGVVALEKMRSATVGAVILDLTMPEMDGFGVLDAMHADKRLVSIPAIVITASDDKDSQLKAMRLGALDVITKPFDPDIVTWRVENLFARSDAIREAEQSIARYRLHDRELYMSEHDALTGLLNRNAFARKVRELVAGCDAGAYVVSYLNINDFKVINDRFGHSEGDRLLRYVTEQETAALSGADCIICRDSADIFLSLQRNDPASIRLMTERLLSAVAQYDLPMRVEDSIGRYAIDDPAMDVNLMIDNAMLAARSVRSVSGCQEVWFNDDMRRRTVRQQELVSQMHDALAAGQFVVYFQPQYNYVTGRLIGAETLVRWRHPKEGLIPPHEFIPLFEQNGFIQTLDRYVWEQACIHLRAWLDKGHKLASVSVNISRRDLYEPSLVRYIYGLTQKYALKPEQLHLEITESAYVENPNQLIDAVTALQKLGFIIEIDDFGSGYSSLNTLKDVPVDVLKLDMQFVKDTEKSQRSGSILSSVVRMASWLKLPVIAEGVETREMADYLKSIGCDLMQGYLFSEPVPAEAFEKLLLLADSGAEPPVRSVGTDISGAADYLSASAQATLLFNSFVGGAYVAEFDGSNVEMLRVNDGFYEMLHIDREAFRNKKLRLLDTMSAESQSAYLAALRESIRTGRESQCETRVFPGAPGAGALWTFNRIRFLAQEVNRYIFYVSVENITPRKELDALREHMKNVVENIPAGTSIMELHGDGALYPVFASDRTLALFGYTQQDYARLTESGAPLPLDALGIRADGIKDILSEDGGRLDTVMPAKRRDGAFFWMRVNARKIMGQDGLPVIFVTLFDATQQHFEDQEMLLITRSLDGGIYRHTLDSSAHVTKISDNLLDMLGFTRAEFAERFHDSMLELIYEPDRHIPLDTVRKMRDDGVDHGVCEFRLHAKDGVKWVHVTGQLFTELDGRQYLTAIAVDISKTMQLLEDLAEKNRQTDALIENVPGGVECVRIEDGKIVREFTSPRMWQMLGCDSESDGYFGADVFAHCCEDEKERMIKTAWSFFDRRTPGSAQCRIRRKDGNEIYVSVAGYPAVSADGVLRYYCSYTDITEQKRREEQLEIEKRKTELAVSGTGLLIWEYDIANKRHTLLSDAGGVLPAQMEQAPGSLIEAGIVSAESADAYRRLHQAVDAGQPEASAEILQKNSAGDYAWQRITYHTVFSRGVPVSAVGAALDITAETDALASKREFALALNAASLYIWTYDIRTGACPVVNGNAARLGVGRTVDGKTQLLRDSACLLPESRKTLFELFGPDAAAPVPYDGSTVLHIDRTAAGMEWMKLSWSVILGADGQPASLVAVGEDISQKVELENRFFEAVSGIRKDQRDSVARVIADLTENSIEVLQSPFARTGMPYSAAIAQYAERIFTSEQADRFLQTFGAACLTEAYRAGRDTVSMELQRRLEGSVVPKWVRITASQFMDAQTGHLMSFQSTVDIYGEVIGSRLAAAVAEKGVEMLAVIYVESRYMHCPRYSAAAERADAVPDCPYDDYLLHYIDTSVRRDRRDEARRRMDLASVCKALDRKEPYTVICPLESADGPVYKRWMYFWLDAERTAIVWVRIDVSDLETLGEYHFGFKPALVRNENAAPSAELNARQNLLDDRPRFDADILFGVFRCLYDTDDEETAVGRALGMLGERFDVSRVYVFESNEEHTRLSNTFEWCAPGVSPEIDSLQELSYAADSDLHAYFDHFDAEGMFLCADIAEMPEPERRIVEPQGIRAMLQFTLTGSGVLGGMIGFDENRAPRAWEEETVGTLMLASEIIGTFLHRQRQKSGTVFSKDFCAAIDNNCDFIYIIDPDTHEVMFTNRAIRDYFLTDYLGCRCYEEFLGKTEPCDDCPALECNKAHGPVEIRRPDGMWMRVQASPVFWRGRRMAMLTCVDITAAKETSAKLTALTDAVPVGIVSFACVERTLVMQYFNDAFCSLVGCSRAECEDTYRTNFKEYVYEEDIPAMKSALAALLADGQQRELSFRARTRRGMIWIHIKARKVGSTGKSAQILAVMMDNTKQMEKEKLLAAAENDSLTGLLNRAALEARVTEAIAAENKRFALLMLDIDNLKEINDTFGHAAGDQALRTVAETMRDHFRSTDVIGRIGGDEYMALLTDLSPTATLRTTMASFLRRLSRHRMDAKGACTLRCSVGVTFAEGGQYDFDTLYRQADLALYYVKRHGKNDFAFYQPDMDGEDR